jgi:hypothetical protein
MDTASGIRVHNMGGFGMYLRLGFSNGRYAGPTDHAFSEGDSFTFSAATQGSRIGYADAQDGMQMWPVADIQAGEQGHEAGDNVIYDGNSPNIAVYKITGGCWNPSFSYQGTSTDPT